MISKSSINPITNPNSVYNHLSLDSMIEKRRIIKGKKRRKQSLLLVDSIGI
jgi:hypothetical protein